MSYFSSPILQSALTPVSQDGSAQSLIEIAPQTIGFQILTASDHPLSSNCFVCWATNSPGDTGKGLQVKCYKENLGFLSIPKEKCEEAMNHGYHFAEDCPTGKRRSCGNCMRLCTRHSSQMQNRKRRNGNA